MCMYIYIYIYIYTHRHDIIHRAQEKLQQKITDAAKALGAPILARDARGVRQ